MNTISSADAAEAFFRENKNCSQAVLCAFAKKFDLDERVAARLACGLGGGVGRMRDVCGAVSSAAIVLGLRYGEDKAVVYPFVQEFCRRFREKAGSIVCRELLAKQAAVEVGGTSEKRTENFYATRPCVALVRLAADVLDDLLK